MTDMKIQTPRGTEENLPIQVIWNGKELGVKEVDITFEGGSKLGEMDIKAIIKSEDLVTPELLDSKS